MLGAAVDVGQRQGPRWAAQLLLTALGDAGRAAEQQRVLRLHGVLQVHLLKLDGHIVDSHTVEDFSNFPTGVLIAPVLLILDVQGGNDLSAYKFPDVHFMYTANPGHGREFTHYKREEQTISEGSWKQGPTTGGTWSLKAFSPKRCIYSGKKKSCIYMGTFSHNLLSPLCVPIPSTTSP